MIPIVVVLPVVVTFGGVTIILMGLFKSNTNHTARVTHHVSFGTSFSLILSVLFHLQTCVWAAW